MITMKIITWKFNYLDLLLYLLNFENFEYVFNILVYVFHLQKDWEDENLVVQNSQTKYMKKNYDN